MIADVPTCKAMLLHVAKQIKKNTEMLNEADRMGDSDHGTGMEVGFSAVEKRLETEDFSDLGHLFKACGMAIMMSAGGASGVLFGCLFKEGAKALDNVAILDSLSFSRFLELGLASVMHRGKASKGDKTMVDALSSAVECSQSHLHEPLSDLLPLCVDAARQGSEATGMMQAVYGRMKVLGERSIGYVDPGSITVTLILSAMSEFLSP